MRLSRFIHRARRLAGASWTLLVVGLCAWGGSEARGDCAQDSRHRVAFAADLMASDAAPGSMPEATAPRPERPKPCNGPSCSGNPATPGTTATLVPPSADAWGILVSPVQLPTPPSTARPDEDEAAPSDPARSAIFHPPRRPA